MSLEWMLSKQFQSFIENGNKSSTTTWHQMTKNLDEHFKIYTNEYKFFFIFENNKVASECWKLMYTDINKNTFNRINDKYLLLLKQILGLDVNEFVYPGLSITCNWMCFLFCTHKKQDEACYLNLKRCIQYAIKFTEKVWNVVCKSEPLRSLQDYNVLRLKNLPFNIRFNFCAAILLINLSCVLLDDKENKVVVFEDFSEIFQTETTIEDDICINIALHQPQNMSKNLSLSNLFYLSQALSGFKLDSSHCLDNLDQINHRFWSVTDCFSYYTALVHYQKGNFKKSLSQLSSENPCPSHLSNIDVSYLAALCYSCMDRPHSAIQKYRSCLSQDISFARGLCQISKEYKKLKLFDAEMKALGLTLQIMELCENTESKCSSNVMIQWYCQLMDRCFSLKDSQLTVPAIVHRLATRSLKLQNYSAALEYFNRFFTLLESSPCMQVFQGGSLPKIYNDYAYCQYRLQKYKECCETCDNSSFGSMITLRLCDKKSDSECESLQTVSLAEKSDENEILILRLIKCFAMWRLNEPHDDCIFAVNSLLHDLRYVMPASLSDSTEENFPRKEPKLDDQPDQSEAETIVVGLQQEIKSMVYLNKGLIYELMGQHKHAEHHYRLGLNCNPGNEDLVLQFCNLLLKTNLKLSAHKIWKWAQNLQVIRQSKRRTLHFEVIGPDDKANLKHQLLAALS